jgi:hypothetical protein
VEDDIEFMLFLATWETTSECVEEFDDDFLNILAERWKTQWLPSLKEEHTDCKLKRPLVCTRCVVERIFKDAERIRKARN